MGEADLCTIDETIPETLDDGEKVMVLGGEDELSGGLLDGIHVRNADAIKERSEKKGGSR